MNQDKIGKFIAELRKEKKMTQCELANKLGITDRAISKWENGRGMPDLSLLMPLCEILGVSINELLSGARLDKNDYMNKLEENIVNTIDYSDEKIKKTKNIFKIILSTILVFIAILMVMYSIDVNRMRNNKQVLFSTWGFSYAPPIDIKEKEMEVAIINYLTEIDDEEIQNKDEKAFASMKMYLIEDKNKYYNVYAWVLEEKYYLEGDEIKQDSSSSIPYKFVLKNIDGKFSVVDSKVPRDVGYYFDDMKEIFPRSVRNDMNDVYNDGTIEELQLDIKGQVKLYFHK